MTKGKEEEEDRNIDEGRQKINYERHDEGDENEEEAERRKRREQEIMFRK